MLSARLFDQATLTSLPGHFFPSHQSLGFQVTTKISGAWQTRVLLTVLPGSCFRGHKDSVLLYSPEVSPGPVMWFGQRSVCRREVCRFPPEGFTYLIQFPTLFLCPAAVIPAACVDMELCHSARNVELARGYQLPSKTPKTTADVPRPRNKLLLWHSQLRFLGRSFTIA